MAASAAAAVETMIVMESFGRGLVLEPYLATVVLGGGLVSLAGSAAQKKAILPQIAAGKLMLAFAHGERQSRYELTDVETTAKRDGARLCAQRPQGRGAHGGDSADKLIVSARTAGGDDASATASRCSWSTRKAKGVTVRGYPTVDGLRAAEVTLDNVSVGADALLGAPRRGLCR